MINVVEISPPRKLSGKSSLLITFPYNPVVIDVLKSFPTHYYHKKEYAWELPISDLPQILDKLCLVDSVRFQLADDIQKQGDRSEDLTDAEARAFRWKPFKHQIDAINFTLEKKKILLLDEMGLGKTNEMVWAAETLKRRGLIDHCLVICCVNSLKQNWKKEIEKYSTESAVIIGERKNKKGEILPSPASIKDRAEQLRGDITEFFVILNVESLRDDKIVDAISKSKSAFGMICVDEIHRCANKSSQQGENLLKLPKATSANYIIGATGTLLTNTPVSCWLPLHLIDADHSILTMFKSQYCKFGGFHDAQIIGYKNLDLLQDEIKDCSLRRTKDVAAPSLPPKTITYEIVEMSEAHRKLYDGVKNGVKEEADKIELNASNLLALTTRLRQATSAPSVLTSSEVESSKVERAAEIVRDLAASGEKVVVLSNFIEPVYRLAEALKDLRVSVNTGDQTDDIISKNVDRFQSGGDQAFIGTYGKVGTGLTLNAAAYMVCLDTPWTWAQFSQGTDRIHRINNTRPAFITVLACKDTIDERVMKILEDKKDLADYMVDGAENKVAESVRAAMLEAIQDL